MLHLRYGSSDRIMTVARQAFLHKAFAAIALATEAAGCAPASCFATHPIAVKHSLPAEKSKYSFKVS